MLAIKKTIMSKFSVDQLKVNYEKHLGIIKHYISGGRKALCIELIDSFGPERYAVAPFSSRSWFPGAYDGGYVYLVNKITEFAVRYHKFLVKECKLEVDYSEEELAFSALFHSLGKLGIKSEPYFLPQKESWRKEKLKEEYSYNEKVSYMSLEDRALFNLQEAGIPVSEKEYLAIRLYQGLYNPANENYLLRKGEKTQVRSTIVYVLKQANEMCSHLYVK